MLESPQPPAALSPPPPPQTIPRESCLSANDYLDYMPVTSAPKTRYIAVQLLFTQNSLEWRDR